MTQYAPPTGQELAERLLNPVIRKRIKEGIKGSGGGSTLLYDNNVDCMEKLTMPLKSWKDSQGNDMYRLGDLPAGIKFKIIDNGPTLETISYPRSAHTGKRQCKDIEANKFFYEFCTKKVYIVEWVSEEFEK